MKFVKYLFKTIKFTCYCTCIIPFLSLKKLFMKLLIIFSIICCCWLVFAQSCMQMRISDSEAKQYFAIRNASFTGEYFKIKKRTIHYVVTGKNFLPTLVFLHGSPGSWKAF